jgi:heat shock protein HspQ
MGIYASDSIFGIRIYNFNNDLEFSNTLFEEKYDEIMTHEQMREAYLFYAILYDKKDVFFKVYVECTSTLDLYNKKSFMDWYPMSLNTFLEKFNFEMIKSESRSNDKMTQE